MQFIFEPKEPSAVERKDLVRGYVYRILKSIGRNSWAVGEYILVINVDGDRYGVGKDEEAYKISHLADSYRFELIGLAKVTV